MKHLATDDLLIALCVVVVLGIVIYRIVLSAFSSGHL